MMNNFRSKINAPSPVTLPEELIIEVLSLLKVKPLMRFKCVSKSCNSIISDPFFVKIHLHKSSRNPHIIIFSTHKINNPIFFFPISILENPPIDIFKKDSEYQLIELCHHFRVIGSCNGFICLLNSRENEFCLWNPATTSSYENLASFLLPFQHNPYYKYSLGYDNFNNKYKLVAFSSKEVRVFTFGDNVWKNIVFFSVHPYPSSDNNGVYLSNTLNWFALLHNFYSEDVNVDQFLIISLDFGTETYTHFPFPREFEFDELPSLLPIVCKLMDCLCFYHHTSEDSFVIWQMKEFGVENSWTKLLRFDYHSIFDCSKLVHLLPLHVFENGDMLILASNVGKLIRYYRKDDRVVLKPGYTSNCMFSHLRRRRKNLILPSAIPYVESLVSYI